MAYIHSLTTKESFCEAIREALSADFQPSLSDIKTISAKLDNVGKRIDRMERKLSDATAKITQPDTELEDLFDNLKGFLYQYFDLLGKSK